MCTFTIIIVLYNKNQWIIFLKIWRIILNEIVLSSASQPVVCACDFIAAPEPFYHPDRVPDYNVLIYVAEGTVYVTEGDTDYDVGAGELLFLKHHIRHHGKNEIARGTKWFFAHFYLAEPENGCVPFAPDAGALGAFEPLRFTETLPKKLTGLKNGHIEQRISEIAEYCRVGDELKRMRINGMFYSFLADIALSKYMDKNGYTLSCRICSWLGEHCCEPFSTQRLEQEFFLSYKRMAAVFKREQGRTMQQYHSERRMMKATYLLRSTLIPIGEIAAQLGFDDPLYFSRCFHAFSGVSPRDYRLSARTEY